MVSKQRDVESKGDSSVITASEKDLSLLK